MSRLNDLLRRLENSDAALAKDLKREVDALADRRAFGLNFERHVPEAVELPGRPVRRGDKVRILPPRGSKASAGDERLWRVVAISKDADGTRTAALELISHENEKSDALVEDLVVVAEFRDPIYPGLVSTGKVERGGDKPYHAVINAENYHALQTLLFTHRAKVDAIYIDPPYNTGSDGWIYSDKYISDDDHYKHSKWLAFMERRLYLAKALLKPTGVIIVAVGDEEHHRLRLLMDQVFDSQNFISDVVWQGGRKNDSRYVSNGADYMLIYARDEREMAAQGIRWREKKGGAEEAIREGRRISRQSHGDLVLANKNFRLWLKASGGEIAKLAASYNNLDEEGRVYRSSPLRSPNPRPNLQYDLLHPVTGKPVNRHANGWSVSREQMDRFLAEGLIIFGEDETKTARFKGVLTAAAADAPTSVFEANRLRGSSHLAAVLGSKRFPNPKDHEVLMRWLGLIASTNAVILDFFGGSGTTAEVAMRLNHLDGGTRRSIVVTNNEVSSSEATKLRRSMFRPGDPKWEARGVYEYVTRPRVHTVASGVRDDGMEYSDGLDENVEFFTLTYEAPLRVSSNREFTKIAPLLWLRAGSQGRRIEDLSAGWDVADTYGVLADLNQSDAFVEAIANSDRACLAFIVTDEDRLFESVVRELPEHVEPVRLYEAYLQNFEIETGRSAL